MFYRKHRVASLEAGSDERYAARRRLPFFATVVLLFGMVAIPACRDQHTHAGDAGHEQAKAEEKPTVVVTDFTERTELFVEYPALVVGAESPFAAHLTSLSDFRPVAEGTLTVRLSGGGAPDETFSSGPSNTPGIFRPIAKPAHLGKRRLSLELSASTLSVNHDLGEVAVHPDPAAAVAATPKEEGPPGLIPFLKEQQWKVDFATAPVEKRTLRRSVPATGTIRGSADGDFRVSATAEGHLLPGDSGFPRLGQQVTRGGVIVRITPRLGSGDDVVKLRTERAKADTALRLAVQNRERQEAYVKRGSVPAWRLEEARAQESLARAELDAAEARLASAGGPAGAAGAGVALRAPIDGTIVEVGAAAGQFVREGDPLFRTVDLRRLWLEARVPEADGLSVGTPDGAWFEAEGLPGPQTLDGPDVRLIAAGGAVDPVSRTVSVVFEFANPGPLKVGMSVAARVRTGEAVEAVAVPLSALVEDGGQDLVFVMVDGEHFERRIVRTGIRDGNFVEVTDGLRAGERIVTRGAYLVRLASTSPAQAGHGHAH